MASNRKLSENPIVALEAPKLLGMRQVAKVSAGCAYGASGESVGGAGDLRAEMSKLLSKIGAEL